MRTSSPCGHCGLPPRRWPVNTEQQREMHQQLTDKTIVCKDLIEALEQCHGKLWAKYFGGCNDIKNELNMCLRKERFERTRRNAEESKIRQERRKKALEELHKDD